MAIEVLSSHKDLTNPGGNQTFPLSATVHLGRTLTATAEMLLDSYSEKGGGAIRDRAAISYSVDGGIHWQEWWSRNAYGGMLVINEPLTPIRVAYSVPTTDIQVQLVTNAEMIGYAIVKGITLTCSTVPLGAAVSESHLFGF